MKALITGGSGLLGCELLANLHDAVLLSRDPAKTTRKLGVGRSVRWDPAAEPAPLEALQGVEAVFNLAGEPVASGRSTESHRSWSPRRRLVTTATAVTRSSTRPHQRVVASSPRSAPNGSARRWPPRSLASASCACASGSSSRPEVARWLACSPHSSWALAVGSAAASSGCPGSTSTTSSERSCTPAERRLSVGP